MCERETNLCMREEYVRANEEDGNPPPGMNPKHPECAEFPPCDITSERRERSDDNCMGRESS